MKKRKNKDVTQNGCLGSIVGENPKALQSSLLEEATVNFNFEEEDVNQIKFYDTQFFKEQNINLHDDKIKLASLPHLAKVETTPMPWGDGDVKITTLPWHGEDIGVVPMSWENTRYVYVPYKQQKFKCFNWDAAKHMYGFEDKKIKYLYDDGVDFVVWDDEREYALTTDNSRPLVEIGFRVVVEKYGEDSYVLFEKEGFDDTFFVYIEQKKYDLEPLVMYGKVIDDEWVVGSFPFDWLQEVMREVSYFGLFVLEMKE